MIKKSFIHIPGVGRKTESEIWSNGINEWEDFFKNHEKLGLSEDIKKRMAYELSESIIEYEKRNMNYFGERFPSNEHWRAYKELKKKCCFVDIETTGLSKHYNIITVIGLYDGKESKMFVNGKNLHKFSKEISKYDMVVTYNGAMFDLPFIKAQIKKVNIPDFHVDLRYPLRNLGYVGGLKSIERQMGIKREEDISEIDGFEAVRLWKAYEKGDKKALKLLLDYNKADIVNLKPLMEFTFENMKNLIENASYLQ